MGYAKEIIMWCDECGQQYSGCNTVMETREELRQLGWIHIKGKDYCSEGCKNAIPLFVMPVSGGDGE